jgi:putative PEP-CTERM system histidine kinase
MQSIITITAISLSLCYPLFLLFRRGKTSIPISLIFLLLASAGLEFFDFLAFTQSEDLLFWKRLSLGIEALLPPIWLWFTLTYARQTDFRSIPLWQRILIFTSPLFLISVFSFPVSDFIYSPDFASEKILFLGKAGYVFYLFLLIYLIVPLINLEMTLVSATHSARWKIKFELLGTGLLLAVMIYYYSHALLFHTINMNIVPARTLLLIVAVIMMAYSRLIRGNGVRVYVSQQILYKSVALLAVGGYLIGLGIMGEVMKYFGDDFQRSMAIATAFAIGLGLVISFFSESVRRKVLIYIRRNFYKSKYDYRTQWLQFTDHLARVKTGDELLHSIVAGFTDTFGMGCGALFVLDSDGEIYRHSSGISVEGNSLSFKKGEPILDFITSYGWMDEKITIPLSDCNDEKRHFFTRHEITFAIPLFLNENMDGFILLGRPLNSNETYSNEDFDLMRTLARQASSALLNLSLSDQLSRARELAAVGRVSSFVMHDLKNQVSALSLTLENAREFISDPEFQCDMLSSIENTVAKMNSLISRLKNLPEKTNLQLSSVDLLQLAKETASMVKGGTFQISGETVNANVDREELQKVLMNLILNAIEASQDNQPIYIKVGIDGTPYLKVSDEGCGISEEYLKNSLFSPFKSTKKKGLGIGLYQCKKIVEAHGGTIMVESELHKGSAFTVQLPVRV